MTYDFNIKSKYFNCIATFNPHNHEAGAIILLTLQMRKLRVVEVRKLDEGHLASNCLSSDTNQILSHSRIHYLRPKLVASHSKWTDKCSP